MKISKIFAGMSAMAIAATMAIGASADYSIPADKFGTDGNKTTKLFGKNDAGENVGLYASADEIAGLTAIKYTITIDEELAAKATIGQDENEEPFYFNYAVGVNSEHTDWKATEVFFQEGAKSLYWQKVEDGVYTVTLTPDILGVDSFFTSEVTYAEVFIADWSGDGMKEKFALKSIELIGVDEPKAVETPAESTPDSTAPTSTAPTSTAPTSKAPTSTAPSGNSDNTNPGSGATAGLALAGLALAGAVAVVAKRK